MNKVMKEMISTLLYLLAVLCLTWIVIQFVGQRTEVDGASMEPTLYDGDNLIVDKISYRFRDPERFDIIVFPFQYKKEIFYIKRIIGLPGRQYRLMSREIFISTVNCLWRVTAERSLSRITLGARGNPLCLERMNILSWATTGTTAVTAGRKLWEMLREKILSAGHGFVSGLLRGLES